MAKANTKLNTTTKPESDEKPNTAMDFGDSNNAEGGNDPGPNMTEQEYEALTGKRTNVELSLDTLRPADPSRLSIAATIAAGMLGQGRYTALLRDDRMVQDLAVNSLRVADALIAAAEPQA